MPDFAYFVSKLRALLFTANAIYFFKPSEMLVYPTDWTREVSPLIIIGSGSCFFFFSYILDVKIYGEKGCWMHLALKGMALPKDYDSYSLSFFLFLTLPLRFFSFFLVFFIFFLLSECYLVFVVAAFRLACCQAGSGMRFTAFAVAVTSMMTEMLLLLLVVVVVVMVVVVEEEVMVVVTVVAVEVVPVGGVYLLTITLEG